MLTTAQFRAHHAAVVECIVAKRPVTWITYSNGDKTQKYLQTSSRNTGQVEPRLVYRGCR